MKIELTHPLAAAPEAVFSAWTNGEAFACWFPPPGAALEVMAFDARAGGSYRFRLSVGSETFSTGGTFLDLAPPSRLSFGWVREDGGQAGVETRVEISIRAHGDGSELVLTHSGLADPDVRTETKDGWVNALQRLNQHLISGG